MSDYTVDDSMAKIIYELNDREIYNDVRAEIGVVNTETVVDADPTYEWKFFTKTIVIGIQMGPPNFDAFYCDAGNALSWKIEPDHYAWYYDSLYNYYSYYHYDIWIESSDASKCVVGHKNIGVWSSAKMRYTVGYKYLASEGSSHEEQTYNTLTVRATDDTSIRKYGRRVLPLVWPQGSSAGEMQSVANANLARYKEPVPVLSVTIQGKDDALATQIFTREISDIISVVCGNLGMASTDFFIDKISIRDSAVKIPICTWGLTGQRDIETTGWFMIDTDMIDGAKLIAGSVGYFIIDTDSINGYKLMA